MAGFDYDVLIIGSGFGGSGRDDKEKTMPGHHLYAFDDLRTCAGRAAAAGDGESDG